MNDEIHDFNLKNKKGTELEDFLIQDIIKKKYKSAHKYIPNNGDYDIFIDEINEGIEVKYDDESKKTGNICIEYGQDSRLSGISITKAKYWIQFDGTYLYLALTSEIKRLIRSFNVYHIDLKNLAENLAENDKTADECDLAFDDFYAKSKEVYGDMYDDIKSPISIIDLPNKRIRQTGYDKYMGLYLLPKDLFSKYCLEIALKKKMKYDKLI